MLGSHLYSMQRTTIHCVVVGLGGTTLFRLPVSLTGYEGLDPTPPLATSARFTGRSVHRLSVTLTERALGHDPQIPFVSGSIAIESGTNSCRGPSNLMSGDDSGPNLSLRTINSDPPEGM